MKASPSPTEAPIDQIKVTLEESHPPIWRRLLVPGDVTLAQLHDIIQVAMGWEDYHLHQFIVGNVFYGEPHPDYGFEMRDERRVTLREVAPQEGSKFCYEYDFGDGWLHQILVEKVLPPEPEQSYPVCIKGKRACPPEDVGGIWGYYDFLEASGTPTIRSMRTIWSGSAGRLTLRRLTWRRSTKGCRLWRRDGDGVRRAAAEVAPMGLGFKAPGSSSHRCKPTKSGLKRVNDPAQIKRGASAPLFQPVRLRHF